jgi:hypothetical protein
MSITEIASTGLLRVVAPTAAETSATDVPDHALRAVALATLATSAGMLRPSRNALPSRAVKAAPKSAKRAKLDTLGKSSGDYGARAHGRPVDPDDDTEPEHHFDILL